MATVSEDMLSDDDFQQENPVNQAPNRRYMDDDVDDFLDETENENTAKKTKLDVALFTRLNTRAIYNI